jgi:hypothetical protein
MEQVIKAKTTIFESLEYKFSEVEKQVLGQDLARAMADIGELEEKKKKLVAEFKSQIQEQSQKASSIARRINNGYEYRETECVVYFNKPKQGFKEIYRTDSGEFVREARMSPSEMQLEINLTPEANVS